MPARAASAGERDAGADFADRLVDQSKRALAMTVLVRRYLDQLATRRLQQGDGRGHARLRADRIADANAGGDGGAEHGRARGKQRNQNRVRALQLDHPGPQYVAPRHIKLHRNTAVVVEPDNSGEALRAHTQMGHVC
jgi:hypothetical protein